MQCIFFLLPTGNSVLFFKRFADRTLDGSLLQLRSADRGQGCHDGGGRVGGGAAGRRRHLDFQPRCPTARHHARHY